MDTSLLIDIDRLPREGLRLSRDFEFLSLDLVYLPEEIDGLADELIDEKIDQMYYSGRQLDLRGVVLEQLNLTFPAKPLCRPDCEGICAVCGEIVRDAKCSCLIKESDPRWNKLKFNVKDKS